MVTTRSGAVSERKRSATTREEEGDRPSDDTKARKTRATKGTGASIGKPAPTPKHSNDSSHRDRKQTSTAKPSPSPSGESRERPRPPIFTVGHGTRTLRELIAILQAANVTKLVDVRSIPRSWTNPQFNRETLQGSADLGRAGIEYAWLGDELGGRRNKKHQPGVERHSAIRVDAFRNYAGYMCTSAFREGLEGLENRAWEMGVVAIMCSETVWWRCHRRMISDALASRGWEVWHLGVQREPMPHKMWDIARVDEEGELIYDVT